MGKDQGCCHTFKVSLARLLYECIGTMLLTMVFVESNSGVGRTLLALWVLTVFCWRISGSHFNPAISFAFMLRKDTNGLPRLLCLFYILFQCLGATIGAMLTDWLQVSLIIMQPCNVTATVDGIETIVFSETFRAVLQELIGSFIYVLFFLTQTEDRVALSKEKGIVCLIVTSSYITARAVVYGQQLAYNTTGCGLIRQTNGAISSYGAVLNPAIAFGVSFAAPLNEGQGWGEAFKWFWLYPCVPFVGAIIAIVFYELVYKKAREICAQVAEAEEDNEIEHEISADQQWDQVWQQQEDQPAAVNLEHEDLLP